MKMDCTFVPLQLTNDIASPRNIRADNLPVAVQLARELAAVDLGLRLGAGALRDIVTRLRGAARRCRGLTLALASCI